MATGKPWTEQEQREIVRVYMCMLAAEERGHKYNKAAIRRATLPRLEGRSGGSYEMKMQNISAVLAANGDTYVKGYKPLPSIQRSLKTAVLDEWRRVNAGLDSFEEAIGQLFQIQDNDPNRSE